MKRHALSACGLAIVAVLLSSCTGDATSVSASGSDTSMAAVSALAANASASILPAAPAVTNDLAQGSVHKNIEVPGEAFQLEVDYWITSDPAAWTTLNAKTLHSSTHTAPAANAEQPTVLVEFTETRAVIRSTDPDLDGQEISNHRDAPATGALPGYMMDVNVPYEGLFTIDSRSQQVLGRWAELGRTGPVTSTNLVAAGVYANEITVTYSLLIRGSTETDSDAWHRRLVQYTIVVSTPNG